MPPKLEFTNEDLNHLLGKPKPPKPDRYVPAIDNPPMPDPMELLLTGQGRWRDSDVQWQEEKAAAWDLKHGINKIPAPEFDHDEPTDDEKWAPIKARLAAQGAATLARCEARREEQDKAQKRAAAREILKRRGLLR
jgi:hypothetical protein